jgi:hypothetical protein
VFESFARATTDSRVETVLTLGLLEKYRDYVKRQSADARSLATWEKVLKLEMAFERSFVEQGGMLLAGADPTGWGGALAGFADQRNIELLVEAGLRSKGQCKLPARTVPHFCVTPRPVLLRRGS